MPSMPEQRDASIDKLWDEDDQGNLSRKVGARIPYTVQEGDTWNQIAEDHGVPLDEMDVLNPDVFDPDKLKPGQIINIGTKDPKSVTDPTDAEKREYRDPTRRNWEPNPDAPVRSRVRKALGKFDKD